MWGQGAALTWRGSLDRVRPIKQPHQWIAGISETRPETTFSLACHQQPLANLNFLKLRKVRYLSQTFDDVSFCFGNFLTRPRYNSVFGTHSRASVSTHLESLQLGGPAMWFKLGKSQGV